MGSVHLESGIPFHPSALEGGSSRKSGKRKAEKGTRKGRLDFSGLLQKTEEEGVVSAAGAPEAAPGREELSDVLDDVFSRGEALKESPTLDRIKDYRRTIQQFFQLVTREAVEMDSSRGLRNPKNLEQKQYYVLRKVDSKLDDLARAVLQEQKDAVSILARVDEINSLLVDLLH